MSFSREHQDPYLDDQHPLAIDRQRVIHSAAFRRLQYKTQVFVARREDHFRTRLTHTLEVASMARRIAGRLELDPELAEVVALAHDLGHPPFGHAGERALDECMRARGGRFEHNQHTLRVVTELEHPYPDFRGLNLTAAVLRGLRTHQTKYDRPDVEDADAGSPEGRAADLADEFAYVSHDLQDGVFAGLLEPVRLSETALWRDCYAGAATRDDVLRNLRPTIERIQATLIADVANASSPERIRLSEKGRARLDELDALLFEGVYRHEQVVSMDEQAERIVREVFQAYVRRPSLMPGRFAERVDREGATGVSTDYVAGMTDRFCRDEHARLCM